MIAASHHARKLVSLDHDDWPDAEVLIRMRWTSDFTGVLLLSSGAGDLEAKSEVSAGSLVGPPDHSCLAGLRRSRTPLPGPRGRHWPTKCS